MKILFTKSKWEAPLWPIEIFLDRVAAAGFAGTEIHIPDLKESPADVRKWHAKHGLAMVAQITSTGHTPQEHWKSLRDRFHQALRFEPIRISSHTGRDTFTFEENRWILEQAISLANRYDISFTHETHRGRSLYSAVDTRNYLAALPGLRLTADFSHWFVVHESDLSDQPDNLAVAISRADHIHARVGFTEGPQVSDPRAPEYREIVQRHVSLWREIVTAHERRGTEFLTVTPEFGPAPYMPSQPYTKQPISDPWEINLYIHEFLQNALNPTSHLPQ